MHIWGRRWYIIEVACGGSSPHPQTICTYCINKNKSRSQSRSKSRSRSRSRQRQKQNHKQKQNQKQKQPSNSLLLSQRFGPVCAKIIASSWRCKGRSRSRSRRIFRTLPAEPLKLQLGMRGATIALFFVRGIRPADGVSILCLRALEIST